MFNATLTGNLGRDPELKTTQSGQMVSSLSVAVRQPKRNGEDQPAFWVKVEVWGKQAEYCCDFLKKGNPVCCTGVVTQEEWTDQSSGEVRRAVVMKNASVEGWAQRDGQQQAQPVARQAAQSLADAFGGEDIPF
jgi:single-strand DNA-binding protein